jgi:hypothetical protein
MVRVKVRKMRKLDMYSISGEGKSALLLMGMIGICSYSPGHAAKRLIIAYTISSKECIIAICQREKSRATLAVAPTYGVF